MIVIRTICGFLLTGLFLTLCQSPFDMSILAWIGFLPLIFVASPDVKKRWLFLFGYLACAGYWLASLYWLQIPTMVGYVSFCLYMGVYWPLMAICVRYIRYCRWSLTFLFPVLIVGFEAWQGWILGGFSWRLLGHSMYGNLGLIQVADIFGVAGVSFLVAMANGFVAEILLGKVNQKFLKLAFVVLLLCATMYYGHCRLDMIEASTEVGPVVTTVQTNEPLPNASLNDRTDEIFDSLIQYSGESLIAKPELIIWPETMVLETLEHDYINLRGTNYKGYGYNTIISSFAANNEVQIIVGATGGETEFNAVERTVSLLNRSNAAYVYNADGKQDAKRYDKIHLIPFGEYIPFEKTWPWLHESLKVFSPYANFDSLVPGKNYHAYDLGQYNYGIIICYEDTLADLTREMVLDESGKKRVNWLVNISNDGWFCWRDKNDRVLSATTELVQHAIICSFRAIENRVGIVRSVNTGISCFIEPSGRIVDGFVAGNMSEPAFDRRGVEGYVVDNIKINGNVTFFSKYGQWADYLCGIFLMPILFLSFVKIPLRVNQRVEN